MGFIQPASAKGRTCRRALGALAGAAVVSIVSGPAVASAAPAVPGSPNFGFGSGGTVLTQFGLDNTPSSIGAGVAVAANGDIYQAGYANSSTGIAELYLARFLPSGALDTTFGTGGVVYENAAGAGGSTAEPGITPVSPVPSTFVALTPGGDPVVLTDVTSAANVTEIAAVEFTPTGQLNSSFGSGGVYEVNPGGKFSVPGGLAIDAGGNIVFTGTFVNASGDFEFVAGRLTSNGAVDSSFATSGLLETTLGSNTETYGTGVIAQSNGDLVFDAEASPSGTVAVLRTTATGQADSGFGNSGVASVPYEPGMFPVYPGLTQTPDGGYAVATGSSGASNPEATVTRLSASGQLDTSFGTGGTASIVGSGSELMSSSQLLAQPNGDLIVTGYEATGSPAEIGAFVAELNGQGKLETSFGTAGLAFDPVSASLPTLQADAAETPDGNLVLSDAGLGSEEAVLQEVSLDTAPTVVFAFAPSSVQTGTPVEFVSAAVANGGYALSPVSWDFGSGSFGDASGSTAVHTFTSPGTYTVRAEVTDAFGLSTVSTQTIHVTAAPSTTAPSTPATSTPATSTGQPTVTPAKAPASTLKIVKLKATGRGKISVTLLCAFAACKVNASVTTHTRKGKGKAIALSATGKGKTTTVASAKLSLSTNQKHTYTLKLNQAGRKLLARYRRVPVTASFRLSGGKALTKTLKIK